MHPQHRQRIIRQRIHSSIANASTALLTHPQHQYRHFCNGFGASAMASVHLQQHRCIFNSIGASATALAHLQ
jgi:hypothetical protein